MRLPVRNGLAAALASALVVSSALAQQSNPAGKAQDSAVPKLEVQKGAKPLAPLAPPMVRIENAKEALATVNAEPITRGEVIDFLSQYPIPVGKEQEAYDGAMESIVNRKLLTQFLSAQRTRVEPKQIDDRYRQFEKELEARKQSVPEYLSQTGLSTEEIKSRMAKQLQWETYLLQRATEPELLKFFNANKDLFDGKMVRASHLLLKVAPDASEPDKEKAKQKILAIRNEIVTNKISFADAANKYSEEDAGTTKNGGDLDFFPRRGKFLDAFSDAAFALNKNQLSQPVLTEYGWHLIYVTDIRPGQAVDFKQIKEAGVMPMYAFQLHELIINNERAKAKIDIKPLPKDLFPKVAADPTDPQPTGAAKKQATPK
jgi:peptidyl-prolyl cis-trans isomerase C